MNGILYISYLESPIGRLLIGATDDGLALCVSADLAESKQRVNKTLVNLKLVVENKVKNEMLCLAEEWLDAYFAGQIIEKRLPLLMNGSLFQKKVWNELLEIPYGTTISYSQLAARMGNPKAVRAVANAVGANPLWIVVPCHRVVGRDGSLTGYAGGLDAKKFLLELESK